MDVTYDDKQDEKHNQDRENRICITVIEQKYIYDETGCLQSVLKNAKNKDTTTYMSDGKKIVAR